MGIMGLETYYGYITEMISPEVVKVDLGEGTIPESMRVLNVHISNIVE